ncbi:Diaminopimelate epimerase-like protein [Polyplosphaeria fusca]|uniref:trans-L-3-hydroxyproline dehydratase n=1 Tax=Polyplosphaeria fusca TaxID=682080 RepID=A0A9P4R108_9PLEO|nr:Diaminopimelate epimerase-like protein [Polyplosphaeria fusca]
MVSYVLGIALLAVPAISIPTTTHIPLIPRNGISWTSCGNGAASNLQCANLSVPIDWDAPDGDKFNLGMVKLPRPSNSTAKRIGTLFYNPGGPGASAGNDVVWMGGGTIKVSSDILNSFDIIGVDPRGVTRSFPNECDPAIWNERVSLFPKTKSDYDRLVDKNRRFAESCIKLTGDIVNHLDTISAAKDHEAVRAALGEKMNWLGMSYGSQLGSQYAQLFPDNVRAMVLDGVLQHSQAESANILTESTAYAVALESFFAWANADESSPLKGQDVEKLWYGILKNATDTPMPAKNCDDTYCRKDVTEEEIRFNVQPQLINPSQDRRISLANSLLSASEGDASDFSSEIASAKYNTRMFPGITIGCQDWSPLASSFEDFQAKMRVGETFAPLNKGASQSWTVQASCVGWLAAPANPPAKLKIKMEAPTLLVNSIRDPSTSYSWAVGMLEEIDNSILLTRNGDGHTSWGLNGATTDAINQFLLTAELPEPGTVLDSRDDVVGVVVVAECGSPPRGFPATSDSFCDHQSSHDMDIIQRLAGNGGEIVCVDMHTAGEPARIVIAGYPALSGALLEQRSQASAHYDHIRKRLMLEPAGHGDMYGAILRPHTELTESGEAHMGVLFVHNQGYSTMCGHATMALGRFLVDTHDPQVFPRRNQVQCDPVSRTAGVSLHAPCGLVRVTVPLTDDLTRSDPTRPVSFICVPSFATGRDIQVNIPPSQRWPELGERATVGVAFCYGGAFTCLVTTEELGFGKSGLASPVDHGAFDRATRALKAVINSEQDLQPCLTHPEHNELNSLYTVMVVDKSVGDVAPGSVGAETGFCFFADQSVDRSPTGSAVAARVAYAHAVGELKLNESFTYHSLLSNATGGRGGFVGTAIEEVPELYTDTMMSRPIRVRIEGYAYYIGLHTFVAEEEDPYKDGGFLFNHL